MKEKRDIRLYIKDISDAVAKIDGYVLNFQDGRQLKADRKTYDAVMMNFIIIGEAVKKIYDQAENKYPNIEWRDIMAMRNILVHEYWGIDERVVWDTVKKDLPRLKEIVSRIEKGLD